MFLLPSPPPLDVMLDHPGLPLSIKLAGAHLYTWVRRGTLTNKYLAREHDTMNPARAPTQTTRSRDECTKYEATAPPHERS